MSLSAWAGRTFWFLRFTSCSLEAARSARAYITEWREVKHAKKSEKGRKKEEQQQKANKEGNRQSITPRAIG